MGVLVVILLCSITETHQFEHDSLRSPNRKTRLDRVSEILTTEGVVVVGGDEW